MAMSCTNVKGKTSQPKIITIETPEKDVIGKPCIDFQPDDRWQIKEDDVSNKDVINSKADAKSNTNGRRSLRLSSTKSKDSAPALNGEAANSCSDDDSSNKNTKQEKVVENLEIKNQTRSKRRISAASKSEPQVSNPESSAAKKMRVESNSEEHGDNCIDDKEVNHDSESNNKSVEDSSDKNAMPNLSPAASESKETVKNEPAAKSSEDAADNTDDKKDSEKSKNGENDTDILPKLDKFKKSDVTCIDIEDTKDTKEAKSDPDIEIINVDTKKSDSDCESDSEVQIIGSEESANKPAVNDFISQAPPPEGDMSLSAGYPYYNSLKEKISNFKAGEYKPVKFPHTGTLLLGEHEVIIESPSLLVPLLIKESDEFPKLEKEDKKTNGEESSMMRPNMISKRNFFQSSVGQFLINLGMSRVQEWYQRDMKHLKMKQLKSTIDGDEELEKVLENHKNQYDKLREVNSPFTFRMRRCKFCNFKSESLAVLEDHYLTPHLTPRREYRCNFCSFLTRDLEGIVFHYEAMHAKKANILNNIPFHECTFCSFQHHLKTKVNAHMNRCRKHFIPSQNLAPPFDFEFPGVTTKPVTINDVIGHRRLLLSSAKNQRLPMPDDNNPNSAYARKKLASVLNKITGQNAYPDIKNPNLIKQLMGSQSQMPALSTPSIQLPPGIVITRPRGPTLQPIRPVGNRYPQPRVLTSLRAVPPRRGPPYTNISSTASQLASSGISITPVTRPGTSSPRPSTLSGTKNVTLTPISTVSNRTVSQKPGPPQPVALFTNMAGSGNMMGQPQARMPVNINLRPLRPSPPYQRLNTPPSQVVKGSSGNTFVMCEICDSYIKDLEELRTHMNWVHKVKIHPKMLVSRPPLNCQKCQWRFFTDQGLERHLLGAHGLVTTNMQEMANKNQDGGRCIICGAVFTYKLVSHMTQVHKVTLKPAHLSYKCTVCTATFTLYRLFESHVYNVHSGSAKRAAEDAASSEPPSKKSSSEDSGPRKCKECGLVTENMQDHLIKMHIKECAVKLCHIEKCEKCLYSSDEMLVIRMSDFGLEDVGDSEDDSSEEDDSENSSSEAEEKPKAELVEDTSDAKSDSEPTSKTGEKVAVESEAESKDIKEEPDSK